MPGALGRCVRTKPGGFEKREIASLACPWSAWQLSTARCQTQGIQPHSKSFSSSVKGASVLPCSTETRGLQGRADHQRCLSRTRRKGLQRSFRMRLTRAPRSPGVQGRGDLDLLGLSGRALAPGQHEEPARENHHGVAAQSGELSRKPSAWPSASQMRARFRFTVQPDQLLHRG
jgi:hypothetical protein